MSNQLVITYDNLDLLVQGSNEICINPKGEEILTKLLLLKDAVDIAIDKCKNQLSVAIQEIDPDLSSISSDKVKLMYRVWGAKYRLDDTLIDSIDEKFYTKKETYSPNATEIDKEIKTNGVLPNGIIINERTKSVSITLKDRVPEIE